MTAPAMESTAAALCEHRVVLEAMLLKTGMVLSGKDCAEQADAGKVAEATIRCLRRTVPAAVPGIVFLSGGQSDVAATGRLNAICRAGGVPWKLSFSFGRALQDAATFLAARFSGAERHRRRLAKVAELDSMPSKETP